MISRRVAGFSLLGGLLVLPLRSSRGLQPAPHIRAHVADSTLIVAEVGADETARRMRIRIWGSHRVRDRWEDLDGDGEDEFVVALLPDS